MNEDDKLKIIRELKEKRIELLKRRTKLQRLYYSIIGIALIMIVVVPLVVWLKEDYQFTGLFSLYIITPIALLPTFIIRLRNIEEELKNLDFEIDLQQFEVSKKEIRAEKILLINNYQLRRYYDLNIVQNIWVFGLGIFCIILGIGVIVLTFYLVMKVANQLELRIITGVIGMVGSFMTNYIAAIFLKMHASATTNLSAFHSRLVDTHQLLFGNLFASRIEDDKIRWETLSQLALNLSKYEKD
jgi:Na+/melibiose symporter-like transporter